MNHTIDQIRRLSPGARFEGTFRVYETRSRETHGICARTWMCIGDATGSIEAWIDPAQLKRPLARGYYRVRGVRHVRDNFIHAQLVHIRAPRQSEVILGPALLPLSFCPSDAHAALRAWVSFHESLPPVLQRFAAAHIVDRDRDLAILQDPAPSPAHRHRGGRLSLAAHLQATLYHAARATLPQRQQADVDVTRVGCVLHAVQLVPGSCPDRSLPYQVAPDPVRARQAMEQLHIEDPLAANWITNLWRDLGQPLGNASAGTYPAAPIVLALRRCLAQGAVPPTSHSDRSASSAFHDQCAPDS